MPNPDGSSVVGCRTPSFNGSCVQQGLPRAGNSEPILIEKSWEGTDCTDGVWKHETRGRGDADEDDEKDADHVPDNGHSGHFGVLAGNWGGKWRKPREDDYVNSDIDNSACQVLLMQEVEPLFLHKMQIRYHRRENDKNGRSTGMLVGVSGDEGPQNSLLIAGRTGIVLGIRLRVFHRTNDAPYTDKRETDGCSQQDNGCGI